LTFDLLTLKVTVSSLFPVDNLCRFAAKSDHSFSKYRVHQIGNKRTDGQTDRHVENITPPRTKTGGGIKHQKKLSQKSFSQHFTT